MTVFHSADQKLFADSVQRFLDDTYGADARRKAVDSPAGFQSEHWSGLAGLGALGAAFPEAYGGSGGGAAETAILMAACGRACFAGPVLGSVVLAGGAVLLGGSEAQKQALLPGLVEGKHHLAFAHVEPQARYDLADVATKAEADGDGFRLSGRKSLVLYAEAADKLVVSARTAGAQRDAGGITLFLVDPRRQGVSLQGYRTIDDHRAAEVMLERVRVDTADVLGQPGQGHALIEAAVERGIAALAAEAAAAMGWLHETTLAYLKTRKQFGSTIGSFQALQHRMVDSFTACEMATSMARAAARAIDAAPAPERRRTLALVKAYVDNAARTVAHESVQLHGGVAMTDDLMVGRYVKRIAAIRRLLGDADHHTATLVAAARAGMA